MSTALCVLALSAAVAQGATARADHQAISIGQMRHAAAVVPTTTPIKHLVVIFQENVSFDHYFGTYPNAANPAGEPAFHAAPNTPTVNGLSGSLLTNNPNESNPQRLDRSMAATCDQGHGYTQEQAAYDNGLMDKFVQNTGTEDANHTPLTLAQCLAAEHNPAPVTGTAPNFAVMDYYDGNTVTGLWNYAQHFAMSDNSYSTTFGPSTPGAINVTGTNTFGAICGPSFAVTGAPACTAVPGSQAEASPDTVTPQGPGTTYSDADPNLDVCSNTQDGNATGANTIEMGGQNIGDLLDRSGITWGWFQGGFASPNYVSGQPSTDNLSAVCTGSHNNILGVSVKDYSPHHEPFQYYPSTANPQHLPPTSIAAIGHQDQANHQYDLKDFWAAADNGNLPAVSYLKAAEYQDGHAGYSDPLDEQTFLASTINHLQKLPTWKSTAVIIMYDDSDGWYDHQMGPIITGSQSSLDVLGACGVAPVPSGQQARCGVGPRQPFLVISPFAKHNFVDSTVTDQSSVVNFIEDNWLGSERIGGGAADAMAGSLDNLFNFGGQNDRLFLDPSTGEPTH